MKVKLTKNLSDELKEEFREYFIRALPFRKHLIEVLEKEIDSLYAQMRDETNYENPSWSAIQADRLGQVKAIRRVIEMIKSEEK